MSNIERYAVISSCGAYRYHLVRTWREPLFLSTRACNLAFIMLNPSTADHAVDDPTIRRCMGFARREGYCGIDVVNLYALRATDPSELCAAADPVGPENDAYLLRCLANGEAVAAWGSVPFARERILHVLSLLRGVKMFCLGANKDGSPKHPLYVPKNAALALWEG